MINHTVFMKLKYASGSPEYIQFMIEAEKLKNIPGVLNFVIVKEVSPNSTLAN